MRKLALLLIFTILINSAFALYGDITFNVKDTGEVSITGKTDYDLFQGTTNSLTSKERNIWYLNITSPVFDNYEYLIKLPKYSAINYITANNKFVIGEKDGVVAITGSGIKKQLNVFIEYSIEKEETIFDEPLMTAGLVLLVVIGLIIFIIKRKKPVKRKKLTRTKSSINRELYTERQLLILDYLTKHGSVTQAELEKELKIPKASLSRNIKTLVQKGVIFSETKGMSNIVGLKQ